MIISIASGKGGTGKTTVAVNLALSTSNAQILDCDVEEPNAHIFLKPEIKNKYPVLVPIPEVDQDRCNGCGECQRACEYNAIAVISPVKNNTGNKSGKKGSKVLIFPELCHSCGACAYFCPQKAIRETGRKIGLVEIGEKNSLLFVHGMLDIGGTMSPPIIRAVRKYTVPQKTVIIDAPPGTSCPVIEAIKGSNFCILVTEPTPFGLNDLTLAVKVLKKIKIPFGVVINRSDLGDKKTDKYCEIGNIPVLMRIPFKKEIALAYSKGIPIIEALPEYKEKFQALFKKIEKYIRY